MREDFIASVVTKVIERHFLQDLVIVCPEKLEDMAMIKLSEIPDDYEEMMKRQKYMIEKWSAVLKYLDTYNDLNDGSGIFNAVLT